MYHITCRDAWHGSFWKTEFRQYFGRGKTKVDWNDNNYSGHSADDDPDTSSDTNDHPVSNSDFGIGNGDHFSDSDVMVIMLLTVIKIVVVYIGK